MISKFWNRFKGIIFTIISSLLLASTGVIIKTIDPNYPILQLAAFRTSGQVLVIVPYVLTKQMDWFPFWDKKLILKLLGRGIFGSMGMVFYYTSLKYLSIVDASSILFAHSTVVNIFAWAFLGEKIDYVDIILLITSFLGCFCISQPITLINYLLGNVDSQVITGILCAVLSLFLSAAAFTCIKSIGKSVNFMAINFWYSTSGCILLNLYVFSQKKDYILPSYFDLMALSFLVISGLAAQMFRTLGIQNESVFVVSVTGSSQILFALAFDVFLFKEWPGYLTLTGISLILGAVILGLYRRKVKLN